MTVKTLYLQVYLSTTVATNCTEYLTAEHHHHQSTTASHTIFDR